MLTVRRVTLVSLLVLVASSHASAQTSGIITGRVADETGGVLPGVSVDIHRNGGDEQNATTDATGTYRFENVTPGPAEVVFK
ncbi:MAG: carboxypeptidase-like regulatory domain-containing protein [Vicinamibacterales bacterium]